MLSVVDGVEQLQTFFGQYLPQLAVAAWRPSRSSPSSSGGTVPVALVHAGCGALHPGAAGAGAPLRPGRGACAARSAFKAFGDEFLDAMQGLPTLAGLRPEPGLWRGCIAKRARALSSETFWVLALSILTRGVTDLGMALGAALALILGAYRVLAGRDEPRGAARRADGGDRDLPAAARSARGAASGHDRPIGRGRHQRAPRRRACGVADGTAPHSAGAPRPASASTRCVFAYPGGRRPAHRGLSFSVAPGERVGIVGPSGAGKSSIVRLLLAPVRPAIGKRCASAARICATLDPSGAPPAHRHRARRTPTCSTAPSRTTCASAGPTRRKPRSRPPARAANAHDFIEALPDGYRDDDRRARHPPLRRPAPAPRHRARAAARRADPDPRRGAVVGRRARTRP